MFYKVSVSVAVKPNNSKIQCLKIPIISQSVVQLGASGLAWAWLIRTDLCPVPAVPWLGVGWPMTGPWLGDSVLFGAILQQLKLFLVPAEGFQERL